MHERQQYDHYIRNLEYERDEALRTKTLETAELRKMNSILRGHIRDFERESFASQPRSDDLSSDFASFDNLGIEDGSWDDGFAVLSTDDFGMDCTESAAQGPSTPQAGKAVDTPPDMPFSWNAFYMCLLFGAFIASNSNSTSSTTSIQAAIPPLSDEYRAESANVLKAVLDSGPEASRMLLAVPSGSSSLPSSTLNERGPSSTPRDSKSSVPNLDNLHLSLTTPSRQQQEEAAFSLSATSYNHLTNPDLYLPQADGDESDEVTEQKPSRLQAAYAEMQAARHDLDKTIGSAVHERSLLWERVPEKVLRDFRRMVEESRTI